MAASQIKCVIFDCDGTLVDSERLCCLALCETFKRFNASLTMEQAVEHFEGGKLADILTATQARLGLSVSLDQLEPVYRDILDQLFDQQLKPMDGVFELLDYLRRHDIEFCVASNGPRDKVQRSLELTGLACYFEDVIFSAFDTNSWKPEPDLILYCAMTMGFTLEECLYVDDTPKGLEAGVRAGVETIQLRGLNDKVHQSANQSFDNLHQLKQWISASNGIVSQPM
ncbi:HAD-IA family hydrolase [Vibrio sinaloensis]|uniref:HAD-IA family hydrolase n=1 Tax=Photobacterium sp. (strain ATCC 43367) TaxID=379097 RepID=UPI002057C78A|nr:HAD-IA family hydrolase [Vibrio sinaloensis]UPQ89934.1 HAD-IA family hydrolase [Vibrio sinaloensis]